MKVVLIFSVIIAAWGVSFLYKSKPDSPIVLLNWPESYDKLETDMPISVGHWSGLVNTFYFNDSEKTNSDCKFAIYDLRLESNSNCIGYIIANMNTQRNGNVKLTIVTNLEIKENNYLPKNYMVKSVKMERGVREYEIAQTSSNK
jgi:hypothetical protein